MKKINGYIDHEYKGHKVRLYGEVVGVNESDSTAKMIFENGVVSNGIPMEVIQMDEGVVDSFKKAVSKASEWLKGKFQVIGGMIKKMWNGFAIPFNRASNIGHNVAEGNVPSGVGVYLSNEAKAEASSAGVSVSDQEAPSRDGVDSNGWNEDEAYNNLWKDALKKVLILKKEGKAGSNAELLREGYLATVREQHGNAAYESLKSNPMLNSFFGLPTPINECVESVTEYTNTRLNEEYRENDGKPGLDSFDSENIREAGIQDIVQRIMTQLKAAFKTGEFDLESENGKILRRQLMVKYAQSEFDRLVDVEGKDEKSAIQQAKTYAKDLIKQMEKSSVGAKPVMVWGAPGIGKTSIIQQCRSMFKKATAGSGTEGGTNGFNINMLEVVLSKMTADDFTLPTKGEDKFSEEMRVVNAVQDWIPCWHVTGDKEVDKLANKAANLKMNTKRVLQQHGVDLKNDEANAEEWAKHANQHVNLYTSNGDTKLSGEVASREGAEDESRMNTADDFEDAIRQASANAGNPIAKRRGRPKKNVNEARSVDFDAEFDNDEEIENNDNLTDGGIIFFDELTRAPKGVMNVIMNLVNDRKVGEGWVLGSHWIIVCAANRFYEMTGIENTWEKAFGTRFLQMTFVPKWEDWKAWAMGYEFDPVKGVYDTSNKHPNKIDQEIIDFLSDMREKNKGDDAWYEDTTEKDTKGGKNAGSKLYANPRSWQTASDLMLSRARELHPNEPYIRDPKTGAETINLSYEERIKCLQDAVGRGSATYGAYKSWNDTRYFTPDMIQSIIDYGNITGKPIKEVTDVETKGATKTSRSILKYFVPTKGKAKAEGMGQMVGMGQETLYPLADELVSKIDWSTITNIKLCNILTYFAILTKISEHNNTLFFKREFRTIYTILQKMAHDTPEKLPNEVAAAFNNFNNPDDKQKKIWKKFMKPAYNVFRFVDMGWADSDDNEVQDSIQDNGYFDEIDEYDA